MAPSRVCSLLSLVWRHPLSDTAARAAAPLGAVFTALGLITGALWGKPMWGTYWVWDARLTSFLLLLFLYLGYMALWNAIEDETRAARAAAILALVGVVNIPIIKFSVDWWSTLHQGESIVSRQDRAGLSGAAADHDAGLHAAVRHALDDPHPHRDPGAPRPHLDAGERGMNFDMGAYGVYIWPAYGVSAAGADRHHPVERGGVVRGQGEAGRRWNENDEALDLCRAGRRLSRCWPFSCSAACGRRPPDLLPSALDQQAGAAPGPAGAGRAERRLHPRRPGRRPCQRGQCLRLLVRALPHWRPRRWRRWPRCPASRCTASTQKDKPDATRAFLDEVGNPFARIARDDDGRASIEWGVYGVPETYVVDGKGIIRLKYVGPLSDAALARELMPAIKAAQANPRP